MFVPHTPGGALAKCIQREDVKFASLHKVPRIKVVERGGNKILNKLS